ncbi:MAG: hypothetical protein DRQ49_18355 [Gammaproteobacteria bacterium]|nr:MAG: hypothetical protein DRQ41_15630 [Gammaproteobacteria bacterium]RKZ36173.1 MAG: hypothetical protein DRQ49_18355 [Gammaproteobacteria bacterium]RKZ71377.1 MAG: hypothetical protein DRQ57_18780 [Gammaproteobacteria bacterium]
MSILKKDKSYTFSDYFELSYPTEEIVAELGYQYQLTKLTLPRGVVSHSLEKLQTMFYEKLPYISLTSETAKREMIVAPILLELLDEIKVKIDIEYPVYVSEYLKGNLDYWIHSTRQFLVVEAKKADMEKGFTQLAIELIAMDQYLDATSDFLYGAITIGDLWRFGTLDRQQKRILKDIDSFRVPLDLEELFQVLIGILKTEQK